MNAQAPPAAADRTVTLRITFRGVTPGGQELYRLPHVETVEIPADAHKDGTVTVTIKRIVGDQLVHAPIKFPGDTPAGATVRTTVDVTALEREVVETDVERGDDGTLRATHQRKYSRDPSNDAINAAVEHGAKQAVAQMQQRWFPYELKRILELALNQERDYWRKRLAIVEEENAKLKRDRELRNKAAARDGKWW